jgi:ABC-type antimicrobial peptide transport system permease subunit
MIKSFFTAALRNCNKNRAYTAINVAGLALGIACCMIIFVIVRYETSFDDHHSKAERIYRVNLNQKTPDGLRLDGCNYSPLAEAVRREVTGLEAVTGVYCLHVYQINRGTEVFEDKYAFFADQEYFDVFDVRWMAGNQAKALTDPNTVVVTDAFAEKFLGGTEKALGSTFLLENKTTLTVTGIVHAPPTNTDHPYSILISYPTLGEFHPQSVDNWKTVESGATYVVFGKNTNRDHVYPQLEKIIQKYLDQEAASDTHFFLMALNDNHDRNYDYSSYTYDFPVPLMVILSIVAGMIAFIACINFVNLATAQSLTRAREVGIRKTMGSSRFQLIIQYMSEGFVTTLLAVLTGLLLARIGMSLLNAQYGGNYLRFDFLGEPSTILFIAGIVLLITLLAGFYPAFVLSGYRPVLALKAQKQAGSARGLSLRRGLVILQFTGAQILILVTFIMIHQINQFRDRPIGYNPEAIVMFPHLRGNAEGQYDRLDKELRQIPAIISHTFSYGPPEGSDRVVFYGEAGEANKQMGLINYVDDEYLTTFNITLVAGSNFSGNNGEVSSEVLVNEALVQALGIESPEASIGAIYTLSDQEVRIRGVIRDFYTQSMSSRIDPVTFQYNPEKFVGIAMNIVADDVPRTLADIEDAWKTVYPEYLCHFKFMDDVLDRRYGSFSFIFTFLGSAAFMAIFIGCLGLYGLVSFMAVQRTKEIGIRKVLGATVTNIMTLFTRESAVLIIVAFVLAAPLSHFLGIAMLMELPERVKPGIGVFLFTLSGSLLIACLTVGYRSFNAAIQSPADSLRNE